MKAWVNRKLSFLKDSDTIIEKIFWDSFFIMLASTLTGVISKLVDGLMVSYFLGEEMFAAQSLVSPFFAFVAITSGLLATGAQIQISKCVVKGKFKEADNVFTLSVIAGFTVAAVMTILCFLFDDTIAGFFGPDKKNVLLFEATKDYLLGLSLGSIPLTVNPLMRAIITINGDRPRLKYTTLIVTLTNCFLNALAMLVLDMGMFGVGLATSIAQWLGLLIYLFHFTKRKIMCRLRFRNIQLGPLKDVLARGLSRATIRICNTLRPLLINHWILLLSTSVAVSAVGVNNNIRDLFLIPTSAISLTVMLIAGTFYAERDKMSLYKLVRIALLRSMEFVALLLFLILLFAPYIVSIYLERGTQAHEMACLCLRLTAVGMPFLVLNEFFLSFMLATDRYKKVHVFIILEKFVYVVLFAYVLGTLFGINAVFASFSIAEMCCTLHIFVMVWIKQRRAPTKLHQFMMLPEGFEIDPRKTLKFSISSMDDVVGVSEKVMDFCTEKGVDHRRAYFASLSVEEMASNIVRHGFVSGKTQNLQVRVLYVDDDLILRFRDSCKLFDIREYYDMADKEDISKNVGIRLVMSMAKDVIYVNTLNLNTTIIKI